MYQNLLPDSTNSSHIMHRKQFALAILTSRSINPMSSFEPSWIKIFEAFHQILCSTIFPYLTLPKIKVNPRSLFEHTWYYLSIRCQISSSKVISPSVTENGDFKGFKFLLSPGMAAMLVMLPGPCEHSYDTSVSEGST